jgi:CBS domain-containing protein
MLDFPDLKELQNRQQQGPPGKPVLRPWQTAHRSLEGEAKMKTARKLLEQKMAGVISVAPDATVYAALELMAEHDIGALLVLDGTRLVGMFSERDYARKVILLGKSSHETRVAEIMTPKVVHVTPAQGVDACMALMTERRVRHLPVVENDNVVGILSIGDLVKEIISDQSFHIRQLEGYISG